MARKPKPFLHQGHYYTTAGGEGWRKLCSEEDGFEKACEILGVAPPTLKKQPRLNTVAAEVEKPLPAVVKTGKALAEAIKEHVDHAKGYHRLPNGKMSTEPGHISLALSYLLQAAPTETTGSLTKAHLKAAQQAMIPTCSRKTCNSHLGRMKRFIKWLVEEEQMTDAVAAPLLMVPTLKAFRTEAAEYDPVEPVSWEVVEQTLKYLREPWTDMIMFLWWTGIRPGEACDLTLDQLTLSPDGGQIDFGLNHKTGWRNIIKKIPIGPRAVNVLEPWVEAAKINKRDFVFASTWTKTGNQPRKTSNCVLAKAIERACKKGQIEHWSANQIRHSFGTRVRAELGLEAAQHALGHSHADVTQIYAEKNAKLALDVVRKLG